jgi:hypothetical protein
MNYTILIYESPADFAARKDAETMKVQYAAWPPFLQALKDAGVYVTGSGLQPPENGTTLRFQDGKRLVQDGPFADSKEQLGGFVIVDVPDLDTALDWAAKIPRLPGRVFEVRPNMPPMPMS